MTSVLVWVLIVSSGVDHPGKMANMMGPFVDMQSCRTVQQTAPLKNFSTQCVQVKLYK